MDKLVLRGGSLVLPMGNGAYCTKPGDLYIEGDRIAAVDISGSCNAGNIPLENAAKDAVENDAAKNDMAGDAGTVIDVTGLKVFPGLIDIHIHGAAGRDFTEGSAEAVRAVSLDAVKDGVTAFAASLTVLSHSRMLETLRALAALRDRDCGGARFLGIHSEGPFISTRYKALMDESRIRPPSVTELEEMAAAAQTENGHALILMTFSPHYKNIPEFLAAAKRLGIVMMIGHSEASADQAEAALSCGAAGYTHLYNAMSGHHHRNAGVVTAALGVNRGYAELIADGVHVIPRVLRFTCEVMGSRRIILVTDAMPGKSMPDGDFIFSNLPCIKRNGIAWVKGTESAAGTPGTLAGSAASLNQGLRNMAEFCGAGDGELAEMASANPAKLLGLYDRLGSIEPGKSADIAVFSEHYEPALTIVGGKIVYRTEQII